MAEAVSDQCIVLLGVDGSDHSIYAFDWYVKNFHKPGNKLLLVHVPEPSGHVSFMTPSRLQEHLRLEDSKIADMQARYMDKMRFRGVQGEFHRVNHERPGHAIVETALQKNATFIVIGTRGLGTLRRTIMGSVSDYIVHHSHIPVLLARHKSGWEKEFKESQKKEKKEMEKREKEYRERSKK